MDVPFKESFFITLIVKTPRHVHFVQNSFLFDLFMMIKSASVHVRCEKKEMREGDYYFMRN